MSQKLNFRLTTTSINSHVPKDTLRFPLCPLVEANPTSLYQKCLSLTNKDINFKAYLHVELCERLTGCTPVSGVVNSFISGNLFFCINFISIHYNTQKISEIKNQLQHIRVRLR